MDIKINICIWGVMYNTLIFNINYNNNLVIEEIIMIIIKLITTINVTLL